MLALHLGLRLATLVLALNSPSSLEAIAASTVVSSPTVDSSAPTAAEHGGVTLYLQGMCGEAINGCRAFQSAVTPHRWLVCPHAPSSCGDGTSSWDPSLRTNLATITRAENAVETEHPGAVNLARPRVVLGFSQGALLAARWIHTAPAGSMRAVALIAGFVNLSATDLKRVGIQRVLLAAGRYDLTYKHLNRLAHSLHAAGVAVRFLSLGAVGHTYIPGRGTVGYDDALAWLHGT